jgi:hypothetical protein
MGRFVSIRRIEEQPVWSGSNNRRQRLSVYMVHYQTGAQALEIDAADMESHDFR